jgi:hypothetical protein
MHSSEAHPGKNHDSDLAYVRAHRDALAIRNAALRAEIDAQKREMERAREIVRGLADDRVALQEYADTVGRRFTLVTQSNLWRAMSPLRRALRAAKRAAGKPVGPELRLPRRPKLKAPKTLNFKASSRIPNVLRRSRGVGMVGLHELQRPLQELSSDPRHWLALRLLELLMASRALSGQFAVDAADLVIRRYGLDSGHLRSDLGDDAFEVFVKLSSTMYTRVGRYEDAMAVLEMGLAHGRRELLAHRASVAWTHDPAAARRDLTEHLRIGSGSGSLATNSQRLLSHLVMLSGDDPVIDGDDPQSPLIAANRSLSQGDHAAYRMHIDEHFAAYGLSSIMSSSTGPFEWETLNAGPSPVEVEGPLVTVIMTAYNAAGTIEYALRSVLEQSYISLEVLVVDDCSTDNTSDVVQSFASQDERVRLLSPSVNGGTYAGRNLAMSQARGDYITFHDSDDWMHPERIARQVAFLEARPLVLATRANWIRIKPEGEVEFRRWGMTMAHPNPSSMFLRAEVIGRVGYFDRVRFGADSEFWFRMSHALPTGGVESMPDTLGLGRLQGASLTQSGLGAWSAEHYSPTRAAYSYSYMEWHATTRSQDLYVDPEPSQRPFWAPDGMLTSSRTAPCDTPTLAQAYPLKQTSTDWYFFAIGLSDDPADSELKDLTSTLRSLAHQSDGRWRAIVVAPSRPATPGMGDPRVMYMPGSAGDAERVATDAVRERTRGYVHLLQAGALVHRLLVEELLAEPFPRSRRIRKGYVRHRRSGLAAPAPGDWTVSLERLSTSTTVLWVDESSVDPQHPAADGVDDVEQSRLTVPVSTEMGGGPLEDYTPEDRRVMANAVAEHAVDDTMLLLAEDFGQ